MISSGPSPLEFSSFVGILYVDILGKQVVVPSTLLLGHELEIVVCDSSAAVFALKVILTPFYEAFA